MMSEENVEKNIVTIAIFNVKAVNYLEILVCTVTIRCHHIFLEKSLPLVFVSLP